MTAEPILLHQAASGQHQADAVQLPGGGCEVRLYARARADGDGPAKADRLLAKKPAPDPAAARALADRVVAAMAARAAKQAALDVLLAGIDAERLRTAPAGELTAPRDRAAMRLINITASLENEAVQGQQRALLRRRQDEAIGELQRHADASTPPSEAAAS